MTKLFTMGDIEFEYTIEGKLQIRITGDAVLEQATESGAEFSVTLQQELDFDMADALRQFLCVPPRQLALALSATDTIIARVPSGEASHKHPDGCYPIEVPPTEAGLAVLERVLREQRRLGTGRAVIGTPAAPVQGMIEDWLRSHAVDKRDERGAVPINSLEDIGL